MSARLERRTSKLKVTLSSILLLWRSIETITRQVYKDIQHRSEGGGTKDTISSLVVLERYTCSGDGQQCYFL